MNRFHFRIRNAFAALSDRKGRHCDNVLEAIVLARSALDVFAADCVECAMPWIEIADERGNLVATVRLDERKH
ncbi:MAG TPA: hypothetical protein VHC39_02485 [Rhizomicrobium sp.]|nr:hypothetical protein [Rhizomicrobium sp.]